MSFSRAVLPRSFGALGNRLYGSIPQQQGQKRKNPFSNNNPSSQKIQELPTNSSKIPMSNNRMVNAANGGKLLLISDLEGCTTHGAPPRSIPQSRIMCSPEFFDSLKTFLTENSKNKVAFLGDYFDQGDMVLDSINGIMSVYNEYPGRVIIIAGNRDVNKLRFAYEMGLTLEESKSDLKWPVWNPFYDAISTTAIDLHERIKTIVSKSMGAKYPVHIAQGLGEADANYLLLSCISDSIAAEYKASRSDVTIEITDDYLTFVNNVRQLFSVAKIVHYDADFKTLMSHAGGMDTYFFHDKTYYQNIIDGISTIPEYYSKIEKARQMLMVEPTSKIALTSANIEETLKTYNGLLTTMVSHVFSRPMQNNSGLTNTTSATKENMFCLLQALGLKPDAGKHFVSFIQSCDNTGCKGPAAGDSGAFYDANYTAFQKMLVDAGVKVLASGHVPHCAPVPLVYKRSDGNGLLFVLNDTSNGYRPSSRITGLNKYPLAYVEAGGVGAGVGMLPTLGSDDMNTDEFGPMFGKWTYETAPTFSTESKQVEYGASGALTFPARAETIPPGIFKEAVFVKPAQGGRRTRKNKKAAARKHKKTRKAVRKHKTRKTTVAARKRKHKKTRKH